MSTKSDLLSHSILDWCSLQVEMRETQTIEMRQQTERGPMKKTKPDRCRAALVTGLTAHAG